MPIKHQTDQYRTINRQRYICWFDGGHDAGGEIKKLRAAGVRCRKFGDAVYIHPSDKNLAAQLYT